MSGGEMLLSFVRASAHAVKTRRAALAAFA